jgi:hypothetical protein
LLDYFIIDNNIFYNVSVFVPIKIYDDLSSIKYYKSDLYKKGGVYGIINISKINKQQYIGSSLNLFERLSDHVKGISSNERLQRSISNYGIDNFIFVIYY